MQISCAGLKKRLFSCRQLPHHALREPADRQRHPGGRGALQVRRLQPRHAGGEDVHLCRPPAHTA